MGCLPFSTGQERSRAKNNSFYGAIFERANWWLRDVASSTNFCNVNNNGNANANNSSYPNGVRPDFGDAQ